MKFLPLNDSSLTTALFRMIIYSFFSKEPTMKKSESINKLEFLTKFIASLNDFPLSRIFQIRIEDDSYPKSILTQFQLL